MPWDLLKFGWTGEKYGVSASVGLGPFHASDDFSGTGHNSGAVGDDNWSSRWTIVDVGVTGSTTIGADDKVLHEATGNGRREIINNADIADLSTFSVSVEYEVISLPASGPPSTQGHGFYLAVWDASSAIYKISPEWINQSGYYYVISLTGATRQAYQASGKLRMDWNGSVLKYFIDDVEVGSTAMTSIGEAPQLWCRPNNSTISIKWSNFQINDNSNGDGTGTPIYIT